MLNAEPGAHGHAHGFLETDFLLSTLHLPITMMKLVARLARVGVALLVDRPATNPHVSITCASRRALTTTVVLAVLGTLLPRPTLDGQAMGPAPTPASVAPALSPGDAVRITVWRKPELSGEFVVAASGSVSHPLYREVNVVGVPLAAIEERLRAFLTKYEANPQFVVEPLLRVAIGGEVRLPNLYTLAPEVSITQAVALAGGRTEGGRRDRLLLLRENREIIIDLRRPSAEWSRMPIRSGDQIIVERERAVFRDYVAPTISVLGATAAIISVILYNRNE